MLCGYRVQTMLQLQLRLRLPNQLKEEGIDKKEMGREKFLERAWAVERRVRRNDQGAA